MCTYIHIICVHILYMDTVHGDLCFLQYIMHQCDRGNGYTQMYLELLVLSSNPVPLISLVSRPLLIHTLYVESG